MASDEAQAMVDLTYRENTRDYVVELLVEALEIKTATVDGLQDLVATLKNPTVMQIMEQRETHTLQYTFPSYASAIQTLNGRESVLSSMFETLKEEVAVLRDEVQILKKGQ